MLTSASTAQTPEPPEQRNARMAWWREARFGMFIHWGVYAVAAGQWDGQPVPGVGEWIMHHRQIPVADYEPLAAQFNPVDFDAAEWVSIAKAAGMKYIIITSKHHDGFCLFDSAVTDYDIIDASPFKRDVLRELADECARQGIRLGFYYSIMDWHHPDASGDRFPHYVEYMKAQLTELLTNYGDVAVLWFDGEWIPEWTDDLGRDIEAHCRALKPDLIINNRISKARAGMAGLSTYDAPGDFGTPEQEVPGRGLPDIDWETCMTMNDTWGFKSDDHNWKSSQTLIRTLIDIASKGGNFLLNVGPTAQGRIPEPSIERLRDIGAFMENHGDAIHGSIAGPFDRLPWGRVTRTGRTLNLFVFEAPTSGPLILPGLRNIVSTAIWADTGSEAMLARHGDDLHIAWSSRRSTNPAALLRLSITGEPDVYIPPPRQHPDGSIDLHAIDATVHGTMLRYEVGNGKDNLGFWTNPDDWASWDVEIHSPGSFRVELTLACEPGTAGNAFIVTVGDSEIRAAVPATASWTDFLTLTLDDQITIAEPGMVKVSLRPAAPFTGALMNLQRLRLHPVE